MKTASLLLGSLLVAGVLLASCATPPKATGVTVTVTGFRDAEGSPQNRAIMTLHFASENVTAVGFTRTVHELYLNDRFVGKTENLTPVGLPPMGSVNLDVPLALENSGVVRQILSFSDKAPYRLVTVLHYTDGDDKVQIKVTAEGKVELLGLEQAAR